MEVNVLLSELYIENLAVIEKAEVRLGKKLNVFTGETGAGKSILIGGINAVLGQRVFKDIIRAGTDKAYVSAVFTGVSESVKCKLSELGYSCDDELIISREICADGKSSAKINSRPANVSVLREIGNMLVNIHGQHDSQILLNPEKHIEVLDGFAQSENLLADYRASFKELQMTAREINKIKQEALKTSQREEYLNQIVEDIGSLNISSGEDEAVEARFKFIDNAVSLSEAINTAITCLSGDDSGSGAGEMVARACSEIEVNEEFMKELHPLSERLTQAGIEIGDISSELSRLLSSLDIDENEYAELTRRRNELNRIKRRYGPALDDVISVYESAQEELSGLTASDETIRRLENKKSELLLEVTKKAEALSNHRQKAAERFVNEVTSELSFLNMPDVKIVVDRKKGKLTSSGMDTIEFLISANRGETPKPLAKIASGGELSRIMLALKSVLADRDFVPTLIFDEIDTGVSGRAAQKIGIKLREISQKHQVICVTHLAQIAIMADDHMLIEKNTEDSRTVTKIKSLDFNERKYEIARILGGDNITKTVLLDAEEQLNSVKKGC